MTRVGTLCAALLAAAAPLAAAPAADLVQVVPADATFVAVAADVPQLVESWSTTPLAQMWDDPQIRRFFAPLRAELEIDSWSDKAEKATGYPIDELVAFLEGQVVLFVPSIDLPRPTPADGETDAAGDGSELVVLASVGEHAEELRALLLEQEERADQEPKAEADDEPPLRRTIREFRGVDLHIEEVDLGEHSEERHSWAVVESTFAFATTAVLLERSVADLLDGGGREVLADSSSFRTVAGHVAGSDLFLYLDLARVVPVMRAAVEAAAAASTEPQLVSPAALFDAFGWDVLQAAFATLHLDPATVHVDAGVSYREIRGLVKLLAYGGAEVPKPRFIPARSTSFGAARFDFAAAWQGLAEILDGINPALRAGVAAQINAAAANASVELDLERDLLGNLGDEIFVAELPLSAASAEEEPRFAVQSQVAGLAIRQREGVELAIETLKAIAGQGSELFESRDFLGTQVHSLVTAQPTADDQAATGGTGFSYALSDSHLLVGTGTPEALEAVLVAMGNGGDSVWERSEVRSGLALLPGGAGAIQYQNLAATGHNLFQLLAFLASTTADDDFVVCDPAAVPSQDTVARYLGSAVTGLYRDSTSLLIRMRLLAAEAAQE